VAAKKKYAAGTKVEMATTQNEIRRLLEKHGTVEGFAVAEQGGIAVLSFHMHDRRITFRMPVPRLAPRDSARQASAAMSESRRMWRALLLCIKAKLEGVASGIESFEDAFLAQTVLPSGETMGEYAARAIPQALQGRPLPPLLPGMKRDD
jgi:hypothetical protein